VRENTQGRSEKKQKAIALTGMVMALFSNCDRAGVLLVGGIKRK
jgi:hypothetical protein